MDFDNSNNTVGTWRDPVSDFPTSDLVAELKRRGDFDRLKLNIVADMNDEEVERVMGCCVCETESFETESCETES
eukprot:scaffold242582_cov28-Attheya_sp.AAC.1